MGCAPHSTSGCYLMRKQVASVRHSGRKGCQATWAHLPGVVPAEVPLAAVILHKDAVLDADEVCLAAACAQGHACTVKNGTCSALPNNLQWRSAPRKTASFIATVSAAAALRTVLSTTTPQV